jgi:hypothetical protein
VAATRYLVQCGCDPDLKDSYQLSPRQMVTNSKSRELLEALHPTHISKEARAMIESTSAHGSANYEASLNVMHYDTMTGKKSHAIYVHNKSNAVNVWFFGSIVFFVWLITLFVPFYAWIFIVFSAGLYHV